MPQDKNPDNTKNPDDFAVLRKVANWKELYFYKKAKALFLLTYIFCERFLPAHGDRTVDQMVQAARSGKQNIVEGSEDGKTSKEMELKLLNAARGSVQELREDYEDYAHSRGLTIWQPGHRRFDAMLAYCRSHNEYADYEPFARRWTAEEFCNAALTLCRMSDKMMSSYIDKLEREFVSQGGIRERMYAARSGYRRAQDEALRAENAALRAENNALKAEIQRLKGNI